MPTHIEYRTRGPRWNGTPYLSLASAQYELKALLPGRYRIEQRTVTTTEWEPLAAADREAPAPDERLREAVRDARDHAYLALQVGVPHDRIIDHLRDIWEACSAALAAEDRDEPPCACDGERICAQHTPLAAADREAPDER